MPERIYLDACVLNRLTDRSVEMRVREESDATTRVLDIISSGTATWIASAALQAELARNPDPETRGIALDFLTFASEFILDSVATHRRARQLNSAGFGFVDALHIATAEHANVDTLLTVDDRLIRRAARNSLPVTILNPVDWLQRRPR